MLQIGVQTKNVVNNENPEEGFMALKKAGFSCADFSLNGYWTNKEIKKGKMNPLFGQSILEIADFFSGYKQAAKNAGITIHQMHMPFPAYLPTASDEMNEYLWNEMAPKSMMLCKFLECPYIVVHGFKLEKFLGSEEEEWKQTEKFIDSIAPLAKEMDIMICIENLYNRMWTSEIAEGPCCDVTKAVERIDRINDKYKQEVLGFCFDTGHANLTRLNFEDFITTLDYRLKVLHIHDNDGTRDAHDIPFTVARIEKDKHYTDWDGFVRGLRNIKFDKVLSFETAPSLETFPKEVKQEVLKVIAKTGEGLAHQIENGEK